MSGISIVADSGTQFENGAAQLNSICRLDNNTYCIAFQDNNNGNKATVLVGTRTGTTVSVSFANAAVVSTNSIDCINVVSMSATKIAVAFRDTATSDVYCVICTISGTTVTVGTPVKVATSVPYLCAVASLDSSNIVFVFAAIGNVYACVGSVSGTTPTFGSPQTADSSGFSFYPYVVGLNSTHIIIGYYSSSSGGIFKCVAGTVNTGAQTISFGGIASGGNFSTATLANFLAPLMAAFDSGHVLFGVTVGGVSGYTDLALTVAEINLATNGITFGSPIQNTTSASTDSQYSICTIGSSNALIAYYTSTGTQCEMRGITLTGATTIAFDAQGPVIVDNTTSSYTALCALTSTDFIIGLKEG